MSVLHAEFRVPMPQLSAWAHSSRSTTVAERARPAAHVLRAAELWLSLPVVLWIALDYYRRG